MQTPKSKSLAHLHSNPIQASENPNNTPCRTDLAEYLPRLLKMRTCHISLAQDLSDHFVIIYDQLGKYIVREDCLFSVSHFHMGRVSQSILLAFSMVSLLAPE